LASPTALDSPSSNALAPRRPSALLLWTALVAMTLLWSFNYVAARVALRHMDPLSLAALRIPLAALVMLPVYFSQRTRPPLRARDLLPFTYLGFFGALMNQTCFAIGISRTTSGHAVIIFAMAPVMILLLAVVMRLETVAPARFLGVAISFLGVILLEWERSSPAHSPLLVGDLIILAGTISFALYTVLGKKVAEVYGAISMSTFNLLAASILVAPLAIRQGMLLDWAGVGWAGWAGMFYMAAGSSVVAYTLYYWALRYMEASRVAAVNYCQPLVVIAISASLLGEHPTRHLFAGGALVLFGVFLAERRALSASEGPASER